MNAFYTDHWPAAALIVERLGWVLVHSLWQFAAVGVLVAVLLRLLRHSSSTVKYAGLVAALSLAAAVPVATWFWIPAGPMVTTNTQIATAPAEANRSVDRSWMAIPLIACLCSAAMIAAMSVRSLAQIEELTLPCSRSSGRRFRHRQDHHCRKPAAEQTL
ncbi:MAG TPA: hypothetical protein EYQ63_02175 [Fuerstia sp.]|nr:hypothetical protein [Fuerstiella sp.]